MRKRSAEVTLGPRKFSCYRWSNYHTSISCICHYLLQLSVLWFLKIFGCCCTGYHGSKIGIIFIFSFTVVAFNCVRSCRPSVVCTSSKYVLSPGLGSWPAEDFVKTTHGQQQRTQLIEWTTVKSENTGNCNVDSNWNLPIGAWNMIFNPSSGYFPYHLTLPH